MLPLSTKSRADWPQAIQRITSLLQKARPQFPVIILIGVEDLVVDEKEVVQRLWEELGTSFKIGEFIFRADKRSLQDYLHQTIGLGTQLIFVSGLGQLVDMDRHTALVSLNRDRDVLKQFGCSILVFVPKKHFPEFARTAGDFFDVRSGYFEFSDEERRQVNTRVVDLRTHYLKKLSDQFAFVGLSHLFASGSPKTSLQHIFVTPAITTSQILSENLEYPLETETEKLLYRQLLKTGQKIIILGPPGAGKSMLFKYLALILSQGPDMVTQQLSIEARVDRFPILVPLSAYSTFLQIDPEKPLWEYFTEYYYDREFGDRQDLSELFVQQLETGSAVIMLDGLDEVATQEQRMQVIKRIQALATRYPKNVYLISSRIVGYEKNPLPPEFIHLVLAPLTKKHRQSIIYGWLNAAIENPQDAQQMSRELSDILERDENIGPIASNPLLLTVLIQIYLRGRYLPSRRGDLYRQATLALAETWNMGRSVSGRPVIFQGDPFFLDERRVVELLGPIAFWMHQNCPDNQISHHDLQRLLANSLIALGKLSRDEAQNISGDFIIAIEERSGLIAQQQKGYYAFIHRSFQEYLAACHISLRRDVNTLALSFLYDSKWEEVLVMVSDVLQGEFAEDYIHSIHVASLNSSDNGVGAIIAARCINSAGTRVRNSVLGNMVISELVHAVESPVVPFGRRLQGGELLGELNDPRIKTMIEIPGGKFEMGISSEILHNTSLQGDLRRQLERSAPAHEVHLDTFLIAAYPVTHQQYQNFIRSGGYEKKELWSNDGWKWLLNQEDKIPAYWGVYSWNRPNYPVIGVSWYEAEAYSKWVRGYLPTEAQWEKAARGIDGRLWPWGNEWDDDAANLEAKLGHLTPIGIYPKGKSPYGLYDMAGNVWEWTADWYAPYNDPEAKSNLKVIRGAAWNVSREQAYCTNRVLNDPGARVGGVGFRCVRNTT